jgi:transposase
MRKTKGQPRDFQEMERIRVRAFRMHQKGVAQAEIARKLDVTKQAVSRWKTIWEKDGLAGLRFPGRAGRKPMLSPEQLIELETLLLQGPKAHGYVTELWTSRRIQEIILKHFGVRYHPNHIWRVMRALGWSCQRPTRQARERKEEEVQAWTRKVWTRVKKTPKSATP